MAGMCLDRPHFLASESPAFTGEAVKHLALDPEVYVFNGKPLSIWALSDICGYTVADGTRPHWVTISKEHMEGGNE